MSDWMEEDCFLFASPGESRRENRMLWGQRKVEKEPKMEVEAAYKKICMTEKKFLSQEREREILKFIIPFYIFIYLFSYFNHFKIYLLKILT